MNFPITDFLYLVHKLRIMLLGEFGELTPQEQASQTATGYHHTYFISDDIDLGALMSWSSDEDL